ncbi:MAG: hypothetical protein JSV43_03625 [Methanobacteriota archaeon]|nr:MAG: hypothetical protein JSV43_03625 [Euryarchaeota archaeon]
MNQDRRSLNTRRGLTNGDPIMNSRGMVNGSGRVNGTGLVNGNGLVNGTGLTNGSGLVNGNGLTNGNGLVNGTGLVNGNGFTNGLARLTIKRNTLGVVTNKDMRIGVALFILGLLIIPVVSMYLMEPPYESMMPSIQIDGDFTDWNGIPRYVDDPVGDNLEVSIVAYALKLERNHLSFYAESVGIMLGDVAGYDSWFFFINSDGDASTGYMIRDFGAEFMIEAYGGDNEVLAAHLYSFSGDDRYNWSAFNKLGNVKAESAGRMMEAQTGISRLGLEDDFLVLFCAYDHTESQSCSSVPVGKDAGSLLVEQRGIRKLFMRGREEIMEVNFTAKGGDVIVNGVTVAIVGDGNTDPIEVPFTVERGKTITKLVSTDLTLSPLGSLVSASVESINTDRPYSIRGPIVRAYIEEVPHVVVIDGVFDDWVDSSLDPLDTGISRSTDIARQDAMEGTSEAFFYLKAHGNIMEGTFAPLRRVRPTAGEPGQPAPPVAVVPSRRVGEDFLLIYIDSDSSDYEGEDYYGIRANNIIEIRGINGRITYSGLRRWNNGTWEHVSGLILEMGQQELECSVPLSRLGILDNPRILFVTTDWKGSGDFSALQKDWQTRSRAIFLVESGGAGSHTGLSMQRKVFCTGFYFFVFYYNADESTITWEWSEDGDDWSASYSIPFSATNIYYAAVWYNSSDSERYIIGAKETADQVVYVKSGTVTGNSISWGTEYSVSVSSGNVDSKVTSIAVAYEGYVWLASEIYNNTGYNIIVTRSDSPEDLSSFGSRTPLYDTDQANRFGPIIVPLSGNNMYCVYNTNGNIYGNKFTDSDSTWSTAVTIASDGKDRDAGGPSIVADPSDSVHLLYADTSGRIKYSEYTTSWSAVTTLDDASDNSFPTISLVPSDDLYGFWINGSWQISGQFSLDGGSSWKWINLITADTDNKWNLTSVYSYTYDWGIAWVWDESRGQNVYFERIPEFELILVPIATAILVPILLRRKR